MRLQLISDLHTEFYESPLAFCSSIEIVPDLDFLVIAGDLVVAAKQDLTQIKAIFEHFAKKARYVLYVTGNHEYYGSTMEGAEFRIKSVLPRNVLYLDNSNITLDGIHFFGGTMWFPDDPLNPLYARMMSDFWEIQGFEQWVYMVNNIFQMQAAASITKDTVVITHHLPTSKSTPERFIGSTINRFFISDCSKLILDHQPQLWLHGHTHDDSDYSIGDTHVVCNPFSYPGERKGRAYTPVVFEVEP